MMPSVGLVRPLRPQLTVDPMGGGDAAGRTSLLDSVSSGQEGCLLLLVYFDLRQVHIVRLNINTCFFHTVVHGAEDEILVNK